ncbi:hypothetical protein ACFV2X_19585 [Streptomyces sp. NPDC059679]|uniref:hypothetical protein n=1 Tax=Streptomyces sp. NPDC059679 TaxID=3346903 RepID=UPI0036C719B9
MPSLAGSVNILQHVQRTTDAVVVGSLLTTPDPVTPHPSTQTTLNSTGTLRTALKPLSWNIIRMA